MFSRHTKNPYSKGVFEVLTNTLESLLLAVYRNKIFLSKNSAKKLKGDNSYVG